MAYDKKKLYKQAVDALNKNNLFFIEDIVAFLPCDKTTFYKHFPPNSNELNTIKDMLEVNKIKTKTAIKKKLFQSSKASELLALYRLICTSDEHHRLNQNYIDITSKGKQLNEGTALTKDQIAKLIDKL